MSAWHEYHGTSRCAVAIPCRASPAQVRTTRARLLGGRRAPLTSMITGSPNRVHVSGKPGHTARAECARLLRLPGVYREVSRELRVSRTPSVASPTNLGSAKQSDSRTWGSWLVLSGR